MPANLTDRTQFLEKLQNHCDHALSSGEVLGLLVVDLLNFRRANAIFGSAVCDEVLAETLIRLNNAEIKGATSCRIGNDEFAMIISNVSDGKLLSLAAHKIFRVLDQPFQIDTKTIRLEAVIGYVYLSPISDDAEKLLYAAEKNRADAKAKSKHYLTYSGNQTQESLDWQFESQLNRAVLENALQLHYQPKIDMRTHLPSHSEALVRWPHPEAGLIPPNKFLPILENTGAIVDMTKWAVHTALRESSSWPLIDDSFEYSVAVNVSPMVLETPEFYETVKAAIEIWDISPEQLTLEITEGALVQEESISYQKINRLRDLGLKISIDDFGTGYSCLAYFKNLPADELKIDQSFIKKIQDNSDNAYLTLLILNLGHRFGMKVVAEGIEEREAYDLLAEFGCDYAQGFYISRPLAARDYIEWLKNYDKEIKPRLA